MEARMVGGVGEVNLGGLAGQFAGRWQQWLPASNVQKIVIRTEHSIDLYCG